MLNEHKILINSKFHRTSFLPPFTVSRKIIDNTLENLFTLLINFLKLTPKNTSRLNLKFVIIGSQGLLGKSLHKNLNKTNLLLIDKAYKKNKTILSLILTKKFNFIKLKDKEADVAILVF